MLPLSGTIETMTEFYHVLDKQKEKGPMNKKEKTYYG